MTLSEKDVADVGKLVKQKL